MTDRGVPPDLEGFRFVELIGQGGFADVFLYQQEMPSRRVAVKVLLASAIEGPARDQFNAEANVMAQLSGHPSIVPIYQAGVSRDGRPYLVMEYCPPPSLAGRFRAERFEVPEALETTIKISAAVETAHRAGILHRDIKPHNILISSFGAPMLTDFGIAGTAGETSSAGYGLSVPWSPPEAFGESMSVDPRSDVYSLAATLYSLLAGRSPFEVVGAANDHATLMSRIERQPVPRLSRADVPDLLQDTMTRAMAKDVAGRHPTAMAFARSLQDVQDQLHLAQTRIDVLDASPSAAPVQDPEHRTHVRPVQIIVPDDEVGTRLRPVVVPQASVATDVVDDRTALRPRAAGRAEPVPDTMARGGPAVADRTDGSHFLPSPEPAPVLHEKDEVKTSKAPVAVLAGAALAALIVIGVGAALLLGGEDGTPTRSVPRTTTAPDADDVIGASVVPPSLSHEGGAKGVTFTWEDDSAEPGDTYLVRIGSDVQDLSPAKETSRTAMLVPAASGGLACIEVTTIRGGTRSQPARSCEVNR